MRDSVLLWVLTMVTVSFPAIAKASNLDQTVLEIESGYVEVEGGRIFYETAGHGPAIVMTHDGLLHRETWNAQFATFAESHRVIRWDRRGYGRSDPATAPFRHLDDVYALMKALDIESVALIGCSFGSLVTVEFALEHPQMVSSLVLVGPITSGFGFSEHFRNRGDRGMPGDDATVEQRIEYWSATDPWSMAPQSTAAREAMRKLMVENPQNLTSSGSRAQWPGFSTMERLTEIEVPTLIVVGESDIPDVHAHAGVIQAGIEGSERVVLTNSGHLVHFEVPEAFNRVVLDFLSANE
jgi:pimeloyl-ACP methyl ester carboxylesterase